jgi:DNA-binding response OmpR family regulator
VTDPVASTSVWRDADGAAPRSTTRAVYRIGSLSLEPEARRVALGEDALVLTTTEYEIADRLIRSAGRVVGRDELMADVFGREASAIDRALDVHVSHLRRKLGAHRSLIVTVRGVGYMCRATVPRSAATWS